MEEVAPAKINLSLRVLRRRDDGFHEIETRMAPISLYDWIQVEPADAFEFRTDDPALPVGKDNLVVRAAELFFSQIKREPKIRIILTKKIPHGAGLGGGSSDAAATLRLLNRFTDAKLPMEQLSAFAADLGSDIPFFLSGGAAICRGRGEVIEPAALPAHLNLLLLKPPFGVATPWAYARWRDAQEIPDANYSPQQFASQVFVNDLERSVFEKFVFLARMKTWLLAQPQIAVALMAGSGSTIFAILPERASADGIIAKARVELDPALWARVCETL
jgi:4-diphosphocytidyl-2-C-methyl-D-erythritol kinase